MADKFKIGDCVRHKTSDIKMIVTNPHKDNFENMYDCNYMNSITGLHAGGEFHEFELEEG